MYKNMNISKLSNTFFFLYSPINWIHKKNKKYKIIYVFLQLLIVPYSNLIYIIITFIITLILLKSINLPFDIRKNLINILMIFICFLVVSIHYTTKQSNISTINYPSLKIKPFFFVNLLFKNSNKYFCADRINKSVFYIQFATVRLIFISLIYIFTIKIFLLTTNYEESTMFIVKQLTKYKNINITEISFTIILSSQFLKITFLHINKLRIAYLIRNLNNEKSNRLKQIIFTYLLIIKSFFLNFYINTKFISKSLYGRDILCKDLYVVNIYNK
uniref:Uncharacterized protein n=1 Tax=Synarthrophyton chejuense TaxID=2485825 RepID=A0A3G3MFI2_9FLOR|nr:hypothetical protein [Synarthrophyton chejuense]AYR05584.1 hypothetical protein [Synarthrophyton chejuense]